MPKKRILIITFFLSPCSLTPAQRISYWMENLHKFGYKPIVVTRNWDLKVQSHMDTKVPVGQEVKHVIHENYEVYYLPFRPGMLDKAYLNWGESFLRPLFILVRWLDIVFAYFTLRYTSYSNFLPIVLKILKQEKIKTVLISGAPFYLFKIGHYIYKKYKIRWIADYRDDWTTNELEINKGMKFVRKLVNYVEAIYEKKWVSTADKIISVTDTYTERVSNFLKVPGLTVENGFEEELLDLESPPLFREFTVIYSGTLYPFQDISIILEALKICLSKGKSFRLIFLGSGFDEKEKKRIESLIDKPLQPFVSVTTRLPRIEALKWLQQAHALLGISYGTLKGIPSSKLYEYIGLKKPVLLCPTDNDVMERMLKEVGLGFFAKDPMSCYHEIEKIRNLYEGDPNHAFTAQVQNKIFKYSRGHQLKKLADIL